MMEQELKRYFGYNAFRPFQKEIIEHLLEKKDVVAILPTGAGKSLCYQLPALMMPGIAIVVSPLISLMQDQVVSLFKNEIPAAFVNSSLPASEIREVLDNLSAYKLLYVAPERLTDPDFLERLKKEKISLFVIDEAHCISQWGHSFRLEYRKLKILKEQFLAPIIALTATATLDVQKDIQQQLAMQSPSLVVGSFDRPNLMIHVHAKYRADEQLKAFLKNIPTSRELSTALQERVLIQPIYVLRMRGIQWAATMQAYQNRKEHLCSTISCTIRLSSWLQPLPSAWAFISRIFALSFIWTCLAQSSSTIKK